MLMGTVAGFKIKKISTIFRDPAKKSRGEKDDIVSDVFCSEI